MIGWKIFGEFGYKSLDIKLAKKGLEGKILESGS